MATKAGDIDYDKMRAALKIYSDAAVTNADIMGNMVIPMLKRCGVDLTHVMLVNATVFAFASEIALKTLYVRHGMSVPSTHDLKILYDGLPEEVRGEIAGKMDLKDSKEDFCTLLERNKDAFVDWRYFYEKKYGEKDLQADLWFLREFLSVCRDKVLQKGEE